MDPKADEMTCKANRLEYWAQSDVSALHAKSRVQKYEVMTSVGCINILFIDVGVITECTWSACSEFRCRPSEEYIYFRIFLDAEIKANRASGGIVTKNAKV